MTGPCPKCGGDTYRHTVLSLPSATFAAKPDGVRSCKQCPWLGAGHQPPEVEP